MNYYCKSCSMALEDDELDEDICSYCDFETNMNEQDEDNEDA